MMNKVASVFQCCFLTALMSTCFVQTSLQVRVDLSDVDPPKKPRLEKQENRSSPITVQTSKDLLPNLNDYDETNADDFAMEMGLACVVCRYVIIKPGYQSSTHFMFTR